MTRPAESGTVRRVARTRYREIAETLAAEIRSLPPGSRVASEHEIGERFGVGRSAARAALQDLERRLLVRRVRGRGSFTAARIDYLISSRRPPSWSRTVREAGGTPRTVVRGCDPAPLPPDVAAALGRPAGETAYCLARRSFTDDLPAAWGVEWVPVDVVPELAVAVRVQESLDVILRDVAGVVPVRDSVRASMEAADDAVIDELGLDLGDPTWYVESVTVAESDRRPLFLSRRWIRADAIRVVFEAGG